MVQRIKILLIFVSTKGNKNLKNKIMKTTKKSILESTRTRKISMSNQCNYTYQIAMNENYTKDTEGNVLYNIGNRSERIGYASTKNQFIELVYNHINH